MQCARCAFDNPLAATECARCGVIFGKERSVAPPTPAQEETVPDGRIGRKELTILGIGLAAAIIAHALWLTRFILSALVSLLHEFGHAIVAWTLGHPAIPAFDFVYGCGFTDEHTFASSVTALGPERAAQWMAWWDPKQYLAAAKMPMLWVTGTNDFAYTMNALQKSYRLPVGPRTLCLRPRMPHGHEPGQVPKEIHIFVESVVNGGTPLAKMTGQGRDGRKVWATFASAQPITKAALHFTKDTGLWPKRLWEEVPATIDAAGRVDAVLPDGARVWFINVTDDRDCVASTEHEELEP